MQNFLCVFTVYNTMLFHSSVCKMFSPLEDLIMIMLFHLCVCFLLQHELKPYLHPAAAPIGIPSCCTCVTFIVCIITKRSFQSIYFKFALYMVGLGHPKEKIPIVFVNIVTFSVRMIASNLSLNFSSCLICMVSEWD